MPIRNVYAMQQFWLGAVITFDVAAWFAWFATIAIAARAMKPINRAGP